MHLAVLIANLFVMSFGLSLAIGGIGLIIIGIQGLLLG